MTEIFLLFLCSLFQSSIEKSPDNYERTNLFDSELIKVDDDSNRPLFPNLKYENFSNLFTLLQSIKNSENGRKKVEMHSLNL